MQHGALRILQNIREKHDPDNDTAVGPDGIVVNVTQVEQILAEIAMAQQRRIESLESQVAQFLAGLAEVPRIATK